MEEFESVVPSLAGNGDEDSDEGYEGETRSEEMPLQVLLYPKKKERILRLPLFRLVVRGGGNPEEDGFDLEPLAALPASWIRATEQEKDQRVAFRVGMMIYIARGFDSWSRLCRRTMALPLGDEREFLRSLARLDPYPGGFDGFLDEREHRARAVMHAADELEQLIQKRVDVQGNSSKLVRRLRTLLEGTYLSTSFGKLDFRFLLPNGSLTNLRTWFGWDPVFQNRHRLHPLIVHRETSRAIGRLDKYSNPTVARGLGPYTTVDSRMDVKENLRVKLEKLGVVPSSRTSPKCRGK